VVRSKVERALNAMPDAEARRLCLCTFSLRIYCAHRGRTGKKWPYGSMDPSLLPLLEKVKNKFDAT
jgi:hypothetical protein